MGDFLLNLTRLLLQARSYLAAAAVIACFVLLLRLFGAAQIISDKEAAWIYIIGGFSFLVVLFQEMEPTYAAYRKKRQDRGAYLVEALNRRARAIRNLPAANRQHRWSLEYVKRFHPEQSFVYGQNGVLSNMVDLCLLDFGDPNAIHANVTIYRVPDYIWDRIDGPNWRDRGLPLGEGDFPWDRARI